MPTLNTYGWTLEQWQAHYSLSPTLARYFWVLLNLSADGYIGWPELAELIYGRNWKRMSEQGHTAVIAAIKRLRKHITHGPLTIHTLNNIGYRLVRKGQNQ